MEAIRQLVIRILSKSNKSGIVTTLPKKDLVDFQRSRIEALSNRVTQLEQYVIELCDKECPSDYKKVVLTEILNNK